MSSGDVAIKPIETASELEAVMELYKTQKDVLGFMPDGAFEQRAESRQIFIASESGEIVGYVLFTTNMNYEVRVAHLCVAKHHRRRGIARRLVATLKDAYPTHARIRANCRVDYEAADAWRCLGFKAVRRFTGKKIDGSELIAFSLAISEMPLFDSIEQEADVATVVCDANVVIDIELPKRPSHERSMGLKADWLIDQVALSVTPEIFADLARQEGSLKTAIVDAIDDHWDQVTADHKEVERLLKIVCNVMGSPKDESSKSDQRHIAISAAIEAAAFVTRDGPVIGFRDELFNRLGLRILSPEELVTQHDAVINAHRYEYRELTNSGLERTRVKSTDEFNLEAFLDQQNGEGLRSFRAQLKDMLANPKEWELYRVSSSTNDSVALFSIRVLEGGFRQIFRLRINRTLRGTRLGRVLAEYIADQPLGAWQSDERRIVTITDPNPEPLVMDALSRRGWIQSEEKHARMSLPGIWPKEKLIDELSQLKAEADVGKCAERLLSIVNRNHAAVGSEAETQQIERLIHPGKAAFGHLKTWIVPIRPRWAKELFDFRLWDLSLFDPDTPLVINPDSVFYKKPRNSPTEDVGRILWYVSGEKIKGGGRIRACSALTRRVTGRVKNLYRQFNRFGVYEYQHLIEHFGSPEAEGLAMEFTGTELFRNMLTLDDVNMVLESHGMRRQTFQGALALPAEVFYEIYTRSTEQKA
ncbi:GNAT family N-acetyltransferase [Rhodopirellula sp. SWK7]|uniref:GNAT family N-acetyltransferase n=1 Tax=Rhodopirellula sp. SWK7 TaxID=595460 RepID=UPI0002BFDF4C|nr:GNAT family N-acetyltransferase [Rhodopirellula sp. SWK7]EMI41545.1 GCN5-related N-acetyltransferase [Rhodopirellula sp. SWK7]